MPSSTRRAAPLVAGALLLTAACGTGAPAADRLRADGHADHTAPTAVTTRAVPVQSAQGDPVLTLRTSLERLLGAHVLLADEVVRTALLRQTGQN